MDNESTQDEQSIPADGPTLDINKTVEDENLSGENEFLDERNISPPTQTDSSPVEAQNTIGNTASTTRNVM